jgi:hypothetical protein
MEGQTASALASTPISGSFNPAAKAMPAMRFSRYGDSDLHRHMTVIYTVT